MPDDNNQQEGGGEEDQIERTEGDRNDDQIRDTPQTNKVRYFVRF